MRLDHAGRAADSQVRTPRFDQISAGFSFSERCFSVSSATRPVHTTLVTGLYPFEHGIQGQQDQHVREGAPRLFRQCSARGMNAAILSEAPTIFTGLDLGASVGLLDADATGGIRQVEHWLGTSHAASRCLLLHYWSAHTPYGAADGKALGETADLLRQGNVAEIRRRYRHAVEQVFENKVAPLLEKLDLTRWSVMLFGDHGESWTPDEYYHGMTVHNRVLRVPLYVHVPFTGNPTPGAGGIVSLIDLYATACNLLDLPRQDDGFGIDLFGPALSDASATASYRMAEIRPGRDAVDDRVLVVPESSPDGPADVRWCVFDATYRLCGQREEWHLETQWTEQPVVEEMAARAVPYLTAREAFHCGSAWTNRALAQAAGADEDVLRQRLRALGYL